MKRLALAALLTLMTTPNCAPPACATPAHATPGHASSAHASSAYATPARNPASLASKPLSRMDLDWWRARFAAKATEMAQGPVDLVFYGDSITQDYELGGAQPWRNFRPVWEKYYGGRHALNLGFKGDTTSHLLWRIENGEAAGIHPKAAVVLIGANNFGHLHWPAAETEAGIVAIVNQLHQRLPGTHILLLGVLPSIRNPWVDANTATLNHALAHRYGSGADVTYKDLSALFMRDGHVDPDLFMDTKQTPPGPALHPTAPAQAAMAEAIEPTLSAWLGDHKRS